MNNEETKVLNQAEETKVTNDVADNKKGTEANAPQSINENKESVINSKGAYAAGGFVAGLASGVAGSAFATNNGDADIAATVATEISEEVAIETEQADTVVAEDTILPAPDPEEALLATDEGIRIAQVDDNASFAEAFADARAQVGPGGAFEWRGQVYNTYYAEEWNNMSAAERAGYQSKIDYTTIAGNAENEISQDEQNVMASDTEMVDCDTETDGVKVLGVEAVVDNNGNPMTVAAIEVEGEQALLVDVDNDGTMDVLIADDNHDNQIDPNREIYDISNCNVEVDDLMHNMEATRNPDTYLAYNDDMPDYMNDADVSSMA